MKPAPGGHVLEGKNVLLGVTGGIAAYKAPLIVRELTRLGASVRVVMTRAAHQFVAPIALQAVSGAPVGSNLFDPVYEEQIGHIELARWADAVLIAPATANLIGKLAHGLADDLLSTILLATRAPIVVAPAMNTKMLTHSVVQANMKRLGEVWGATIVPPDSGQLACLEVGPGRMPDPPVLVDAVIERLLPKPLAGRHVVVTLGPTRERIDDVRFLTNASSGRMGFAMCLGARHLGARVTAIAGPVSLPVPSRVALTSVESADEMREAMRQVLKGGADIAVFTAAVSDARPVARTAGKITKGDMPSHLELTRTPDILASVCLEPDRPFCVGFAAETGEVEARTIAKCARKGCDLMIGNDVTGGAAFASSDNSVVLVDQRQVIGRHGPASKNAIAHSVWPQIVERYEQSRAQ